MSGLTLLQAAENVDADAVRALLAGGADVNERNSYGETALMSAAARGSLRIVDALLAAGADVNARRADGFTALIQAAFFGHRDVVSALIAGGADVNAADNLGMTAHDWARSRGCAEIARILKSNNTAGAREPERMGRAESPRVVSGREYPLLQQDSAARGDDLLAPPAEGGGPTVGEPPVFTSGEEWEPLTVDTAPPPDAAGNDVALTRGRAEELPELLLRPAAADEEAPHGGGAMDERGPARAESTAVVAEASFAHEEGKPAVPPPATEHSPGVGPRLPDLSFGYQPATQPRVPSLLIRAALVVATLIGSSALTWVVLERFANAPADSGNAPGVARTGAASGRVADVQTGDDAALTAALRGWIAATNGRDVDKLMTFYAPRLTTFYRLRDVSNATVRREKIRRAAGAAGIRADDPAIKYSDDRLKATTRFRKTDAMNSSRGRAGVVQELIWLKTNDGWKIISERESRGTP